MTDSIVQTPQMVTLIGAGPVKQRIFADTLRIAPYLIAADGGAEMAQKYGENPKKLIGDLDSVAPETLKKFARSDVHQVTEQDTTDFDKAMRIIVAPLILGLGFVGRRVDHQLAAFHSLLAHRSKSCILIGRSDIVFHLDRDINMDLKPGTRVSLFPLAPTMAESSGLAWPIKGLNFRAGQKIGTSNRALGPVSLSPDAPGMLVILPRRTLPAVVSGFVPGFVPGE